MISGIPSSEEVRLANRLMHLIPYKSVFFWRLWSWKHVVFQISELLVNLTLLFDDFLKINKFLIKDFAVYCLNQTSLPVEV
jgi:hypothetical protein